MGTPVTMMPARRKPDVSGVEGPVVGRLAHVAARDLRQPLGQLGREAGGHVLHDEQQGTRSSAPIAGSTSASAVGPPVDVAITTACTATRAAAAGRRIAGSRACRRRRGRREARRP